MIETPVDLPFPPRSPSLTSQSRIPSPLSSKPAIIDGANGDNLNGNGGAPEIINYLDHLNELDQLLHGDDLLEQFAEDAGKDPDSWRRERRRSSINMRLEEFSQVIHKHKAKLQERGRQFKALVGDKALKELIAKKKTELNEKMNLPPFLRLVDKCAFTLGIIVLFVTEFFLLRAPELMYVWYTVLIFPLLAIRFVMYHRLKWHFFMLDFCYLCQFLLLFYLFGHQYIFGPQKSPALFKLVFALTTGPLAWGTVVWRNKLVFHDVDKLTSVFIHLYPPLVTYCLRWFPVNGNLMSVCGDSECSLGLRDTIVTPLYFYLFWQVCYFLKTEILDRKKLQNDKDLMTSLRWMTQKEPHPIYQFCVSRGYKGDGVTVLMVVQLVYTLFTLLPLPILFSNFWIHTGFLLFVFICTLWSGASYYFEVFSESYSKRLQQKREKPSGRKLQSVNSSTLFFSTFLILFFVFLNIIL